MQRRRICWGLLALTLGGSGLGCEGADYQGNPESEGSRDTAQPRETITPSASPAEKAATANEATIEKTLGPPNDCSNRYEEGTWYNQTTDSPYRVDVIKHTVPSFGCYYTIDVWEKQSDGSLYHRGTFPLHDEVSDSERWMVSDPYGVGGYFDHPWVRFYATDTVNYLRVWIYHESLDSKPDAIEDQEFLHTRPPETAYVPFDPPFRLDP